MFVYFFLFAIVNEVFVFSHSDISLLKPIN